jgi:phosphoribosylformylglycinamidine synthase PurS subunit
MKKFLASIRIMPHDALLDPQGKAITSALINVGLHGISSARMGKHITCEVRASDKAEAEGLVQSACEKLLCNQIMEKFEFHVSAAE